MSITHLLKRKISKDQSRDTGMAMVLLFLILFVSMQRKGLLGIAIALHVLNMIAPMAFKHVAVVWLGLSDLIGGVMSRVLMSVAFFGIVTPIGMLRRALGKDPLKLRAFKAGTGSVMVERNHVFTARDIEKPY